MLVESRRARPARRIRAQLPARAAAMTPRELVKMKPPRREKVMQWTTIRRLHRSRLTSHQEKTPQRSLLEVSASKPSSSLLLWSPMDLERKETQGIPGLPPFRSVGLLRRTVESPLLPRSKNESATRGPRHPQVEIRKDRTKRPAPGMTSVVYRESSVLRQSMIDLRTLKIQKMSVRRLPLWAWPRTMAGLQWPSYPTIGELGLMPPWKIQGSQYANVPRITRRDGPPIFSDAVLQNVVGVRAFCEVPKKYLGHFMYRWGFLILVTETSKLPMGLRKFLISIWQTGRRNLWLRRAAPLWAFRRTLNAFGG